MTIRMTTQAGREQATALLTDIMGRASRHSYSLAEEIIGDADVAIADLPLPASSLGGLRLDMVSGDSVPASYRGTPIRTRVVVESAARGRGWILISAERYTASPRQALITLTPDHRDAIVRESLRRCHLRATPTEETTASDADSIRVLRQHASEAMA